MVLNSLQKSFPEIASHHIDKKEWKYNGLNQNFSIYFLIRIIIGHKDSTLQVFAKCCIFSD